MALLSGNVIFEGDSVNYLSSGDIYGTGYFYSNSSNENSIANANFFDSSVNGGTILNGVFQDLSINEGIAELEALFLEDTTNYGAVGNGTFSGNAVNSGVIQNSGIFLANSTNRGTVSGNALFAPTASNIGGVILGTSGAFGVVVENPNAYREVNYNQVGNFIFTGNQINTTEILSGTGIFYNNSINRAKIANGIFFDNSCSQISYWEPEKELSKAIFYDNSKNFSRVCCASFCHNSENMSLVCFATFMNSSKNEGEAYCAVFCNTSVNNQTIGTGSFYDNAINYHSLVSGSFYENSVNAYSDYDVNFAKFHNNSINSGIIRCDAIFLDYSINKQLIMGNAQFAPTATNLHYVQGTITDYLPSGKCWTQTSQFVQMCYVDFISNQNLMAANNNADKIVFKKANGIFRVFCLNTNTSENTGLRTWTQIGSDILDQGENVTMNAVGDRIAIGKNSLYNYASGCVSVYDLVNNNWQLFQQSICCNPSWAFGNCISLNASGNRIAIGVPLWYGSNPGDNNNGLVSITYWNQQFSEWDHVGWDITGNNNEKIGQSVKINASGDRVAFSTRSGFRVYCEVPYIRNPENPETCWQQMGSTIYLPNIDYSLLCTEGYDLGYYANQITMNAVGDKILVAQYLMNPIEDAFSGVVGAFCWNGNSWNQMGSTLCSEQLDDYFGWDIEMNSLGDKIAISASHSDFGYINYGNHGRGKALFYDWNGSDWIENNFTLGFGCDFQNVATYAQQLALAASGNVAIASRNISGSSYIARYEIL